MPLPLNVTTEPAEKCVFCPVIVIETLVLCAPVDGLTLVIAGAGGTTLNVEETTSVPDVIVMFCDPTAAFAAIVTLAERLVGDETEIPFSVMPVPENATTEPDPKCVLTPVTFSETVVPCDPEAGETL